MENNTKEEFEQDPIPEQPKVDFEDLAKEHYWNSGLSEKRKQADNNLLAIYNIGDKLKAKARGRK